MDSFLVCLSKDIGLDNLLCRVCVTGVIRKKWEHKDRLGVEIQDLTGTTKVSFFNSKKSPNKQSLIQGRRIRIYGRVITDRNGDYCIGEVENIELLEEISKFTKELDILDQESRINISRVCQEIRNVLINRQFVEIATRVVSWSIGDEILEPLLVDYPGFGSEIYLSPSPSSQLAEFLTVTMLPKVFTVTSSFSSSYRFPNGSTEMPIVMAKAINISPEEENEIIVVAVNRILEMLSNTFVNIFDINGIWGETPTQLNEGCFYLVRYAAEIPIMGKQWNSVVHLIKRLYDDNGNILLECMHEKLNKTDICSITFYPSQFLNCASKAPRRQIQNLWQLYDGGNLYG